MALYIEELNLPEKGNALHISIYSDGHCYDQKESRVGVAKQCDKQIKTLANATHIIEDYLNELRHSRLIILDMLSDEPIEDIRTQLYDQFYDVNEKIIALKMLLKGAE